MYMYVLLPNFLLVVTVIFGKSLGPRLYYSIFKFNISVRCVAGTGTRVGMSQDTYELIVGTECLPPGKSQLGL